ncbi:hypothetical protein D3H34_08215 [Acidovorax cavernicola]|uniref:Uncharacterized protein n=1 Tax=Acidovorax cavernicola TaxID=1675792 RepID=A0A9X8D711_9BURK|nr:hypothetical protein D3H34_08215 [Acidovorax cavernicola]
MITGPASADIGLVLKLDGAQSSSASGHKLDYSWLLRSKPLNSKAQLNDPLLKSPEFVPDVAGEYVLRLVVSDRGIYSEPVYATLKATTPVVAGPLLTVAIQDTTPMTLAPGVSALWMVTTREFYRPEKFHADFWSFYPVGEILSDSVFPNFEVNVTDPGVEGTFVPLRNQLSFIPRKNHTTLVEPFDTLPGSIDPRKSTEYRLKANPRGLATMPVGQSAGWNYSTDTLGMSSISSPIPPGAPRVATYTIVGEMSPQMVPAGWKANVEVTVYATIQTFVASGGTQRTSIFRKTFTQSFSEDVSIDLDASKYPSLAGQSFMVNVSSRITYQRLPS